MRDNAYAKINLGLDVISRRDDGYHELSMIMVPLHFYDVLNIKIAEKTEITQNVSYIPTDENNIVFKAINIMKEEFGIKENFKVDIIKNIPIQAGLAGGSADAAATLRIIKRLLNLKVDDEKMISIAKKIGADVPFCYINKPAIVKGIGEKLEVFNFDMDFHVLLVKPRKGVSTKLAFSRLDLNKCDHPNIDIIKKSMINKDYGTFISNLKNSLEYSSFEIVKEIKDIKSKLIELGMDTALMSGSGSTVFAITKDIEILNSTADYFYKKGYYIRKTNIKK